MLCARIADRQNVPVLVADYDEARPLAWHDCLAGHGGGTVAGQARGPGAPRYGWEGQDM
jgi:hypothetical protein